MLIIALLKIHNQCIDRLLILKSNDDSDFSFIFFNQFELTIFYTTKKKIYLIIIFFLPTISTTVTLCSKTNKTFTFEEAFETDRETFYQSPLLLLLMMIFNHSIIK